MTLCRKSVYSGKYILRVRYQWKKVTKYDKRQI